MASGFERYNESEIDPLLRAVCFQWTQKIRLAATHKREVFGRYAEECAAFYNGPRSWEEAMCGEVQSGVSAPDTGFNTTDFQVCVNKTFEFVTIFGPELYYENPVRTVKPRMPVQIPWDFFPNPAIWQALMDQENTRIRMDGLRSVLLETILNWTPAEFRLDRESRSAIDEALIKGRGCLWTELFQPPGSEFRVVRSKWETVDDLLIDPDATSVQTAQWIARRRCMPCWQVERDYGLRKGSIRGNCETQAFQAWAHDSVDNQYERKRGQSNDLLIFYQVYSRMGLGGRLWNQQPAIRAACEPFGDFAYVVVAENVPFPMNCPPDVYNDPGFAADPAKVFARFAWPTPFWYADRWPVAVLDFRQQFNCAWPFPHLKAGMGELKFLNWAMSFLLGRIKVTSRTFIAIKKSLGEDMKAVILEGRDLTLLEIEANHPGTIKDLVAFLDHPEVNADIWKIIEAAEKNFDKRVGLNELMYGNSGETQIRSAAEYEGKDDKTNVRPADMSRMVEGWMSEVAANEAIASRYHLRGKDVSPILGDAASFCWDVYVATLDLAHACRQLEYRIEAGSTRRPNKEFEAQTMSALATILMPVLQAYAQQTGDMGPLNNLVSDIAKSRTLDPNRYIMRQGPPAQAVPGAGGQPEAGGVGVAQPGNANVGQAAPPAQHPPSQGAPQ